MLRPRLLSRLVSFWNTLFHKDRLDRDLDDELRAAVDTLAERNIAHGMSPSAARQAALDALGGGVEQLKESVRDARTGAWLDTFLLDLRYACRGFAKAPGLTATIVITLALGIGANTAIFSVVHAMLLAPLPYRDADRLVFIWSDMTAVGYPRAPLSGPELKDLRDRSRTLSNVAAIWSNTAALTGDGDPEQLRIGFVTSDFFSVLGAEPALGRTFMPEDSGDEVPPSILLSWELFERRYGGDASIVGRKILVNDRQTVVVGVMPRHFRLLLPSDSAVPDRLQAWLPFWDIERGPRGQQFLRVIGRMRPEATLAATRDEVAGIAREIGRTHTAAYGAFGRAFNTVALKADDVRDIRGPLVALFVGVGILLLIACVNVASLLIARAASRTRETSLRLALGATRGRLLRQSLADGLILTLLGAAAGLIVGHFGLDVLLALRPDSLARLESARIDVPVFAFTLIISVLWGLLFSLAPLTEFWRAEAGQSLQPTARTMAAPVRYRVRAALVVVQIALSVVLLVSAGLLVRAFMAVQRVDPGFRTDRQLTFRISLPREGSRYQTREAFNTFGLDLRQRLLAIPGVTGAGAISHIPYDDLPNWGSFYRLPTMASGAEALHADTRAITTGLFEMLGVRLIEGRFFTDDDDKPKQGVAIVDERLAQRIAPGRSALGQVILVDPASTGTARVPLTIVGVVPHLRVRSLMDDGRDQIFYPERLVLRNPMAFIVRTSAERDASEVAADVRAAVAAIDPRLPIYDVRPMETYVEAARSARRFTMLLAACFAATALVLTCVGVYGVLAYAVARRRHEFGVRRALGADARQVMREVVRESLTFAIAGSTLGLGVALFVSRLLQSQLYAVHPRDPVAYAAAIGLILIGAMLACWIPVRRAMAVSPMDALLLE